MCWFFSRFPSPDFVKCANVQGFYLAVRPDVILIAIHCVHGRITLDQVPRYHVTVTAR